MRKYPDAIALVSQWISAGHDTSELENAVSDAFEHPQDTPKAIAALRRAIELNPEDDDNYLDFANLCIDHRDFDNGPKVIDVGLRAHPNSYRLVFERGVLYAMEDQFDRAEEDFGNPHDWLRQQTSDTSASALPTLKPATPARQLTFFMNVSKKSLTMPACCIFLARLSCAAGAQPGEPQYREAQSSFEQAVHLDPFLCLLHVALGEIYIDDERFKDAVDQLEQGRAIDPKEKSAYSHLAVAYRRLGDPDSAKQTNFGNAERHPRPAARLGAQQDEVWRRWAVSGAPELIHC